MACSQYTDSNVRLRRTCKKYLDALGIAGRCINCGSFGCVYPAGRGKIAKLTEMSEEAAASLWVKNHPHPMLPKIYGVYQLPLECSLAAQGEFDEPAFAIIREDLQDLKWDAILAETIEDLGRAIEDEGMIRGGRDWVIESRDRHLDFVEAGLEQLNARQRRLLDSIFDLADWGYQHGVFFGDIRLPNLGTRTNRKVVLRDFGGLHGIDGQRLPLDEVTILE